MARKIATDKAPAAIGPYSQAMVVGGLVFTSGQIAINPENGNIEATDVVGQTEQVMKNLGAVLSAAGSSYEKAIKTTCFLSDIADFAAFNEVYAKYFTEKPSHLSAEEKAEYLASLDGVSLGDEICKPAGLSLAEGRTEGEIVLTEGKYHQIKRMMQKEGSAVVTLKRLSFGGIPLDAALAPGAWRYLTEEERAHLLAQH